MLSIMKISSEETRKRALGAYREARGTQGEIARMYGISLRTFQRWWRQFRRDGSTQPGQRGHRRAIYRGQALKRLERVLRKHPDATLEELREKTAQSCSLMAVHRAVERLGYRYKKNAVGKRTKSS